jgi:hypothetical protein
MSNWIGVPIVPVVEHRFYNSGVLRTSFAVAMLLTAAIARPARAQAPAPFPRPSDPQKPASQGPPVAKPQPPPAVGSQKPAGAPTEQMLGVPIYPNAEFIASYDAGRGQRYYLFGTNAAFAEIVNYYKNVLKQKGELVYEEPPIHEFDVGRYREETMAFPPGVTVKDYTWGGSDGYLVPRRGAPSVRFKTIIMIVPVVPGE